MLLEDQLRPLILAEQSVLVDVLYKPERLFPSGAEAKRKCENGGEEGLGAKWTENWSKKQKWKLKARYRKTSRHL